MRGESTHVFDEALQKANLWIKELEAELGWDDPRRTHQALRSTLHALRDRLTINEAAELGAQLPTIVRGVFYEGWRPAGKPLKERHREQFLAHIEEAFRADFAVEPERVARAVFRLLSHHISAGEMEDVTSILPQELRDLFPGQPHLKRRTA